MIQANELRIDNLVMWDGKICKTDPLLISVLYEDGLHPDTTPIPLTEEWLVKFGFENGTTQDLKVITNATITKNGMREGFWNLYLGHNAIDVNFKYIHQLQNLYFALTGTELELTE